MGHRARDDRTYVEVTERQSFHRFETVQGKPVARRGRKARDLPREAARLPDRSAGPQQWEGEPVKANLARFTWAVMLLGAMALTVGAGMRWN